LQERVIFPLTLRVSRLSGTGVESVYIGILRCVFDCGSVPVADTLLAWLTLAAVRSRCVPLPLLNRIAEEEDAKVVRVWCTPTGAILCCDAK
jgi:hypothetical protein